PFAAKFEAKRKASLVREIELRQDCAAQTGGPRTSEVSTPCEPTIRRARDPAENVCSTSGLRSLTATHAPSRSPALCTWAMQPDPSGTHSTLHTSRVDSLLESKPRIWLRVALLT